MKKLPILLASVLFYNAAFCMETIRVNETMNSLPIEKIRKNPELNKLYDIAISCKDGGQKSCLDTVWNKMATGELSPDTLQEIIISAKIISHMQKKNVPLEGMLSSKPSVIPFEIYQLIHHPPSNNEMFFMSRYIDSLGDKERESFKSFVENDFKTNGIYNATKIQRTAFLASLNFFEQFNKIKKIRGLQYIIDLIRDVVQEDTLHVEWLLPIFTLSNWTLCDLILKDYASLYYQKKMPRKVKGKTAKAPSKEILKEFRTKAIIPDPIVPDIYFLDECEEPLDGLRKMVENKNKELRYNHDITNFHIIYLRKIKKIFNILHPLEFTIQILEPEFFDFFSQCVKRDLEDGINDLNLIQSILQLTNVKIASEAITEFSTWHVANYTKSDLLDDNDDYFQMLSTISNITTNPSPVMESIKSLIYSIPTLSIAKQRPFIKTISDQEDKYDDSSSDDFSSDDSDSSDYSSSDDSDEESISKNSGIIRSKHTDFSKLNLEEEDEE